MKIQCIRFWASLAAAALAAFAAPGAALAQEEAGAAETDEDAAIKDAIAFVEQMTEKATVALTNPEASDTEKLDAFQAVLAESLALDIIGRFMLGEARKTMSEAQMARYEAVFPDYITIQYAEQFADIVGKDLEVLDAKAIGARDVIVRTRFVRSSASPIMVDWRVRMLRDGSQKMIDIIVKGVSIMLVKADEFSSFINQNGVDALIAKLEEEVNG